MIRLGNWVLKQISWLWSWYIKAIGAAFLADWHHQHARWTWTEANCSQPTNDSSSVCSNTSLLQLANQWFISTNTTAILFYHRWASPPMSIAKEGDHISSFQFWQNITKADFDITFMIWCIILCLSYIITLYYWIVVIFKTFIKTFILHIIKHKW